MKKPFLLSILLSLFICGHFRVYGFQDAIKKLPTEPIKQARVVYLKWGQKLVCDYVWRDGDTIFVVVHGKKFAIGYAPNEIDMERSFGAPPKDAVPKQIKRVSVEVLYEKSGMGNLINQVAELYVSSLAQHEGKNTNGPLQGPETRWTRRLQGNENAKKSYSGHEEQL